MYTVYTSVSVNLEHVIPRDDDFEHACRDAFQNEPEGICLVRRVIGQRDGGVADSIVPRKYVVVHHLVRAGRWWSVADSLPQPTTTTTTTTTIPPYHRTTVHLTITAIIYFQCWYGCIRRFL